MRKYGLRTLKFKNEWMELTDFLHAGANSCKLKGDWAWFPVPPWRCVCVCVCEGGGGYFSGPVKVCLFLWTVGEVQLGIFLGRLQYQFLTQLTNAGPKSVKLNLTNCYKEVCRIKFYQIATSDVLISLLQFDKMLFNNLAHVFIHWVHYWSFKGS